MPNARSGSGAALSTLSSPKNVADELSRLRHFSMRMQKKNALSPRRTDMPSPKGKGDQSKWRALVMRHTEVPTLDTAEACVG